MNVTIFPLRVVALTCTSCDTSGSNEFERPEGMVQ